MTKLESKLNTCLRVTMLLVPSQQLLSYLPSGQLPGFKRSSTSVNIHLDSTMASSSARARLLAKNDNDVVIIAAVRSALTKVPLLLHGDLDMGATYSL